MIRPHDAPTFYRKRADDIRPYKKGCLFMWWNSQNKKTLLINAIIWTLAAVAALLNVLNDHDVW